MTRSLLNHLVGDAEFEALFTDRAELQAILRFERALAEAEAEVGLIPDTAASAIGASIAEFAADLADLAQGLARDGVVVPALVRQLRAAVEQYGEYVHFGATSQDAVDTGLTLRLATAFDLIDARLAALAIALGSLADRDGGVTMMAHTRMQRALPISVSDKIAAWAAPLAQSRQALDALRPRLLVVQLGGPVGTRAELGPNADRVASGLAERLGLGLAKPWHTDRTPVAEFGNLLSAITGALGKLGADVALLAQNEVATIRIAGGGTSSAMSHKSNPVNAELLVALARFNAGLLGTLHQSLVHEYERSGSAWTLEWLVLPQMVIAAGASLRIAGTLADQISFQAGKPQ